MENRNPPQEPLVIPASGLFCHDEVSAKHGLLSVPIVWKSFKDSVMTRIQRDHPQAESVHQSDMATGDVIVAALDQSRGAGDKTSSASAS